MAFLHLPGLWEVSQDGTKARKYRLGVDSYTPSTISLNAGMTAQNLYLWRGNDDEIGRSASFQELWKDDGTLYNYTGFNLSGSVQSNTDYNLPAQTFPTVAGLTFYRDVEKQPSGGVKFIPPDPSLPATFDIIAPFGYLTDLTLEIVTSSTSRHYVSAIHEYVTRYFRLIKANSYTITPLVCPTTKRTIKGSGGLNANNEIQDQCTTSYTSSSTLTPSSEWCGVRGNPTYPITHVNDGIYTTAALETTLGLEYQTFNDLNIYGNASSFSWNIGLFQYST